MDEIFRPEHRPSGGAPRRVRFLVAPGSDRTERVVECRDDDAWRHHHAGIVDYFEYADA